MGIDLGTSMVLVYMRGTGVALKEPSVVAYDQDTEEILAIGDEARQMLGRTPGNIVAMHPLKNGVISEYSITERMLRYFIQKAMGHRNLRRPRICIGVPTGATEVERNAVMQATFEAGAREVVLIEDPVAAALGSGIDISRACGNMVIDMGAGTTDIAVISLGDTVISKSLTVAGDTFDQAIARYMSRVHGLLIGEQTAENVKKNIGSVIRRAVTKTMEVTGRDLSTGMPKTVEITSDETIRAFKDSARRIMMGIRNVLEDTPPELAADIATRGILLTGGMSMLYGMDELIRKTTGIQTIAVDDPTTTVVIGTGRYAEFMEEKQARN